MSPSPSGSLDSLTPTPDPVVDESELSELTDEDATPDPRPNTRLSRADSDGEGSDGPPPRRKSGGGKRKSRSRNPCKSSAPGSAGRRKKRGGIVPDPMWGWAYKNGSSPTTASPASALVSTSHPPPGPATSSHTFPSTGHPTNTLPNHSSMSHAPVPKRPKSASTTPDAEEEEEEEQPAPPRAMEEEEGEEGDPDHRVRDHVEDDDDDDDVEDDGQEDDNDDEEDEEGEEDIDLGLSTRSRKKPSPVSHRSLSNTSRTRKPRATKAGVRADEAEPVPPDDVDVDEMDVDGDVPDDLPEVSGTEEDYPDRQYPNRSRPVNTKHSRPSVMAGSSSRWDPGATELKDVGRDVQQDVKGVPLSAPESPRDLTPDDEDVDQNDGMDDGADEQEGDGEAPDDEEPSPTEADVDPDHLAGRLGEGDDPITAQDDRESNMDEAEAEEPDEDPDLQPAHRAEALDVLATIEIKFAMLRERVYVEKMEGLAWEEALVLEGRSHPCRRRTRF